MASTNSFCPVHARTVSFVFYNLRRCHLHRMSSFAAWTAPQFPKTRTSLMAAYYLRAMASTCLDGTRLQLKRWRLKETHPTLLPVEYRTAPPVCCDTRGFEAA
jgi:hypothetical protein